MSGIGTEEVLTVMMGMDSPMELLPLSNRSIGIQSTNICMRRCFTPINALELKTIHSKLSLNVYLR